jgi:hypothetical protein
MSATGSTNPILTALQGLIANIGGDVVSAENGLLNGALDKIIASGGDVNVAGAQLAMVAVAAPLMAPTLIPEAILQGAQTAKAILGLINADIAAKLVPAPSST